MTDTYWSQTYSGESFYYADDKIEANVYSLEDIAHHLATVNRYGGAAIYPYSVAQHSTALSVAIWYATHDPVLCLDALFHDAEEVYLGDIRLPMKDRCPEFREMSKPIDAAIRKAMRAQGIPVPLEESAIVKSYDRRLIVNEREFVMQPSKQPWYAMAGLDGIAGLSSSLFEEKHWRDAKYEWVGMVRSTTSLAMLSENFRIAEGYTSLAYSACYPTDQNP